MPVWLRAQEVAELATLLAMSPAAPTGLATVENLAEVRARRAAHAAPAPVAEVAPTPAPRAEAKKPEPRPETKKPEAKKPEPRREAKNPEPTPKPAAHAFEDDEGDQTSADGSPLQLSSERTVVDRFELPAEPPASAVAPVAEVAPAPAIAAHDAAVAAVAALGLEETTPIEPSNVPGAGTAAPLAAVLSAGVAPAAEAPAERAVTGSQPLVAPWIEPAPAAPPPPVGDPFASVPDAPSFHAAKPGETTNSIIRMSGAKKSQGWKALLILGVFGAMLIGAAFYIAKNPSAVGLDPNAFGGEDEGPKGPGIGGTGNFAGLDRLEKHRQAAPSPGAVSPAAASHPHSGSAAASGRPVDKEGAIVTKAEAAPVKQLTDEEKQLLAIAAGDEKHLNFHGPKVEEAPKDVDKASGGLDGAAVMSKVKDNMPAFQRCVQEAARRNPNLKVGKVKIGATIGASGVVTSAVINDPPAMNDSDLGKCLRNTVKRVLFPSFAGDAQEVELPLVLGVGG